jgi:hypothetical protein
VEEKRSTEMMPNKKTALRAVDILPSLRQARASILRGKGGIRDVSIKFHGALDTLGHLARVRTMFFGANDHVRPKSRNVMVLKLGTLEISSDVWIIARGRAL